MARSSMKVTDTGFNQLAALVKELSRSNRGANIGATGSHGDGMSNAELLAIHEFGTRDGHIPERAPLRGAADEYKEEWAENLMRALKRVVKKQITVDEALALCAEKSIADIRRRLPGLFPPLAASTIARKGSSVPLIDVKTLMNSLSYVITK